MKKQTVLILLDKNDKAVARLKQICPDIDIRFGPWVDDEGQRVDSKLMENVDILLCEFPPENFKEFDKLKWIQLTSAGYTQILDLPVLEQGIRVTNGLGIFDIPIAEWNIMMITMWHRNILDILENQQQKIWDRSAKFQLELRGSIIGFYGYGGIARETARLAKSMGLEVRALTRTGDIKKRALTYCVEGTGDPDGLLPDKVFSNGQIKEFLSEVDYLVVGLSLTPATEGIIGENELKMLKSSAVIINPARAKIIKEEAYVKCLEESWIRGSSLDVHYAYPLPPEHSLWSIPNVILTPHISGSCASTHFLERIYDIFVQNFNRYCIGGELLNELSEKQLKGE